MAILKTGYSKLHISLGREQAVCLVISGFNFSSFQLDTRYSLVDILNPDRESNSPFDYYIQC
jgi:hypothetical protein